MALFLLFLSRVAPARATETAPPPLASRRLEVAPEPGEGVGFTLLSPLATGVIFTNELTGDAYLTNLVAHNGAGVALGDVDHDGWTDIYLCNLQGPNRLFRNLGGWRFESVPLGEAACANQFSTAAAFADVDGDGDLDLLVNGIAAGTRLFLNDGHGRWTEAKDSGLSATASATSMALADIDGDGDLDLYCTHYIDVMYLSDPTTSFGLARRGDRWEVTKVNGESTRLPRWRDRFEALGEGKVRELPEVDGLYLNDGHGYFTPIQHEAGVFSDASGTPIPPFRDWGLAVMFRDLNGDGAPDLYVCNDNASPDRVWINNGRGRFRLIDPLRFRHTSRSSMGLDFADVNRDGRDDLFVVDMLARDPAKRLTQLVRDLPDPQARERIEEQPRFNRNTLFLARPDGSYAEVALWAGVAASDWSFCPIFLDVDLDGYEDLLISNGFRLDVMDQDAQDDIRRRLRQMPRAQMQRSMQFRPAWPTPNTAFRNRGDGRFESRGREWGFDTPSVSHGMALGDLDNDGDLDLVVNNLNAAASVYRNRARGGRIAVQLQGRPPNTQGIGAKLRVVGGAVTQSQDILCGGRYLSCDQAMRVFAADPDSARPLFLEVQWRDGGFSRLEVRANHSYRVEQAAALTQRPALSASAAEPLLTEVSLGHRHTEAPFDDWQTQRLLPQRLSRLGPGLCWFDLNGDGWEDLMVSAGRGGTPAVFLSEAGQRFQRVEGPAPVVGDQGALVGVADGVGQRRLLVAASNYGVVPPRASQLMLYSLTDLTRPQALSAGPDSSGPLAAADLDGDGDLDLFVAGRFRPGRYPEPVSSTLWLNDGGQWHRSVELSRPFEKLGLVCGAAFADFNGDGQPDLALALDWDSIRLFLNESGRFTDVSDAWGLTGRKGRWTSLAVGDFDGDGRLDLAAGNRGRNALDELYQPSPLRLFYLDWQGVGSLELIEAWQAEGVWRPSRSRLWLEQAFPELPQRFPTHRAFAQATVPELLGDRFKEAAFVEASQFESGVWLNRGDRFEWRPLPQEAQWASVHSVNVGDLDGDGREDLFLAQNCFGVATDLTRDDVGLGLLLRGQGDGTFVPWDPLRSGVRIFGEQRGAALADFNHDGRLDLAVSQNDAPTRLYRNRGARQGLRVELQGPPANPDAVGALLRVVYANGRQGPCRPVQAGSGSGSQDASAQILGLADAPASLWVRWPGGRTQTVALAPGQLHLRLPFPHE